MPAPSKTRHLERETVLGDEVYFFERDPETDDVIAAVQLPVDLDESLESPEKITISVRVEDD